MLAADVRHAIKDKQGFARRGRALIVGSHVYEGREDDRARYKDAIGVDMIAGPGVDLVHDMETPLPKSAGTFAHVECFSVLEHSKRPWLLAGNIERVLENGGTLWVSVPWMWRFHGYPSDYFRFTTEGIKVLFPGIAWQWVACLSYGQVFDEPQKLEIRGEAFFRRTEVIGWGIRS